MTVVWLIGMGIGALVSAFTFFGSGPGECTSASRGWDLVPVLPRTAVHLLPSH